MAMPMKDSLPSFCFVLSESALFDFSVTLIKVLINTTIVIENGIDNASSNPGLGSLHFNLY